MIEITNVIHKVATTFFLSEDFDDLLDHVNILCDGFDNCFDFCYLRGALFRFWEPRKKALLEASDRSRGIALSLLP